jgi:hypothetical protein
MLGGWLAVDLIGIRAIGFKHMRGDILAACGDVDTKSPGDGQWLQEV